MAALSTDFDAEIVGSGPNGLAAAVVLARAGLKVRVSESADKFGGGTRTETLGYEGVRHDVCSAVHPQAMNSEFFRRFEIEKRLEWINPQVAYTHAVSPEKSISIYRDFAQTLQKMGKSSRSYSVLFASLSADQGLLAESTLGGTSGLLRHPVRVAGMGVRGIATALYRGEGTTSAVLAGLVSHLGSPSSPAAMSGALALGASAHLGGWPIPRGGSGMISDVMVEDLEAHGGVIELNRRIDNLNQVQAPIRILNVHPHAAAKMLDGQVPPSYIKGLKSFKVGPGVLKVDFVTSAPVPWLDEALAMTPTVHLGGTASEVHAFERAVHAGRLEGTPMVIACQPSLFDSTRTSNGEHVFWAYCHVPSGTPAEAAKIIVDQIERHAPGFRETILAQYVMNPADFAGHNANYVGGDILTGAVTMKQLLARPTMSITPWRTPLSGTWIASGGVSPGPSVHGMSGYYAALDALELVHGVMAVPALGNGHKSRDEKLNR